MRFGGLVVVFDTSVIIPLGIEASRSTRLFFRLRAAGIRIAISPQILAEVAEKMRTKESVRKWLKQTDEEIEQFLEDLATFVHVTAGLETARGAVPADPEDDMVIAAAVEAGASYLISEDRHLRDLGQYQGIMILGLDEFQAELDRLGVPTVDDPPA